MVTATPVAAPLSLTCRSRAFSAERGRPRRRGFLLETRRTSFEESVGDFMSRDGSVVVTRTPQEIFADHVAAVSHGDMAAIVKNYADDAVIVTSHGVLEGPAGVESFFRQTLEALPEVELSATSAVFGGNALLLHWTASSPQGRVDDGVDTFLFANGLIQLETSSFTLQPIRAR